MSKKLIILMILLLISSANAFSQAMPSENRVYQLKKDYMYNDVISVVGPAKEKINKKTKKEAVWIYNKFELIFVKDKLANINLHDDRLLLHKSFQKEKTEGQALAKRNEVLKKESSASNLLEGIGYAGGDTK